MLLRVGKLRFLFQATLEDVTGDAVASMLEFMYTDRCADLKTRAAEILPAAEKLDFFQKNFCTQKFDRATL